MGAARAASRYEVLTRIGVGGMASVYVGRARGAIGFSRLVAIKKPHPFVSADAALVAQIEREARVASMIHHPNVVSVLDVDTIDGELALVLDYVAGCTLSDLVGKPAWAGGGFEAVAVRIVLDAAAGLHAAHKLRAEDGSPLGLVHRDVSPQNILVGLDGVARLTDFGIAKAAALDGDHTATEVLKGKLAYLPPEYLRSRQFDARGDLFALAVVAWEALARRRLFKGAVELDTLRRIVDTDAPAPSSVVPVLAPFDAVFARALAREPSERHESVAAFAEELEACARGLGWVASHDKVGAVVERAASASLADRRRQLEATVGEPVAARDEVETASMPAEPPPRRRAPIAPIAPLGVAVVLLAAVGAWSLQRARTAPTTSTTQPGAIAPAPAPAVTDAPASELDAAPPEAPEASEAPAPLVSSSPPATRAGHARSTRPGHPRSAPTLVPSHAPPNPYAP